MAPRVGLSDLPVECLGVVLSFLPLEDQYSMICTCHAMRDIALMFATVEMFRLAYCPLDECEQLIYTSYAGLSKLLLSQPRPHRYLTGFLRRRGSHAEEYVPHDGHNDWAARNWLTKVVMDACDSLPQGTASASQIYDLCYAICAREGEEEGKLCRVLYRQLLERCYNADVIVQQCLQLTRSMATEHPLDEEMYFRAVDILDSALPRLVTFCREATAAADLLVNEHLFYLQCGYALRLFSDSSSSRDTRLKELVETHQNSPYRLGLLRCLLAEYGLQIET